MRVTFPFKFLIHCPWFIAVMSSRCLFPTFVGRPRIRSVRTFFQRCQHGISHPAICCYGTGACALFKRFNPIIDFFPPYDWAAAADRTYSDVSKAAPFDSLSFIAYTELIFYPLKRKWKPHVCIRYSCTQTGLRQVKSAFLIGAFCGRPGAVTDKGSCFVCGLSANRKGDGAL